MDHGISADRLSIQAWIDDVQGHLHAYNGVDIGLDTFPFNGATTTCEALYMGVPVVSLTGRTQPSRMGASILGAAGLPELATVDSRRYVDCAAELAGDLAELALLRSGMRERLSQSRLTNYVSCMRDFESLIQQALETVSPTARGVHRE